MATIGTIPENVTYVSHGEREVYRGWDDFEEGPKHKSKVVPAFISDAANKKTLETGRKWAESMSHEYDYNTNKHKKIGVLKEETLKNDPMTGIKIINLEVRTQGGRAYKIITPHGYYCDLREDVLLDTMLNASIKNGILEGEYIWGRVASQMKLIRVGSELHQELIISNEKSKMPKLSTKEFVPGGIYSTKTEKFLFIGWVGTTTFNSKYRGYNYITGTPSYYEFSMRKTNKSGLWFRISDYGKDKGQYLKQLDDELSGTNHSRLFSLSVKNSNAVIEHHETLVIDSGDYINKIKNIALQQLRNSISGTSSNIFLQMTYGSTDLCCMNVYGEPESVPEDFQPLIEYIEKNPPKSKEKKK